MENSAIIIGVSKYDNLTDLDSCQNDLTAIRALVEETRKFDNILCLSNEPTATLKDSLREFVSNLGEDNGEIFFYFSGHGNDQGDDFYFCLSDFNPKSLHSTALSSKELQALIRTKSPTSMVKIVDACESGTQMIKSGGLEVFDKAAFQSFVLMAACMNNQSTWTGDPFSFFTEKFLSAILLKDTGAIYYTDIEASIRDEFTGDRFQTPYFVHQGTMTETFVDDASILKRIRKAGIESVAGISSSKNALTTEVQSKTISEQLVERDEVRVDQEVAQSFIAKFIDALQKSLLEIPELTAAFDVSVYGADRYYHQRSKALIVPNLEKENRTDELVTAKTMWSDDPEAGLARRLAGFQALASMSLQSQAKRTESYTLELNCSLEGVEQTFTLNPKYEFIKKFSATISFVPSFPVCYVFFVLESHMLTDWNSFGNHSAQESRSWFKIKWQDSFDWSIDRICESVSSCLVEYLKSLGFEFDEKEN